MAASDGNKGQRYREQLLDAAFHGDPIPLHGNQKLELSLHAADPQDASGQLQNEISYPGYARQPLPRDRQTWQRAANQMRNRIEARFALCQTGPRCTATHWALTPAGADAPLYQGMFDAALVIEPGVRPVIDAGMIVVVER